MPEAQISGTAGVEPGRGQPGPVRLAAPCPTATLPTVWARPGARALCAAGEFAYMGLQWTKECYCDNDYGSRGQAPDEDRDADLDGEPDCGTPDSTCGWRNAVYDLAGRRPAYLGCFVDSEDDDGGVVIASGVGGDSSTFTVPYPPGVFGFGPPCGQRYHDFDTFNTTVTLPAGLSFVHAGGRRGGGDWVGDASYSCTWLFPTGTDNQLGATTAAGAKAGAAARNVAAAHAARPIPRGCAQTRTTRSAGRSTAARTPQRTATATAVRQCPADLRTYWTLIDAGSGEILAGGPDASCCTQSTPGEDITPVLSEEETVAIFQLTTQSLSGVRWYLNDSPSPTGEDNWDSCGFGSVYDKSYVSTCRQARSGRGTSGGSSTMASLPGRRPA